MADIDLEEIAVQHREVEVEGQTHPADEDPPASTGKWKKRKQSRQRQNSSSGNNLQETQRHGPLVFNGSQDRGGSLRENGIRELSGHPADGREKDRELPQEDFRAQFYEHYRKEAEEYDRESMKKHDEDLNTTLIFAGLFSAVASAFIIQVHPLLQPDSTDETAALLRVMLYKMDNTTFGGNIPLLPQWTGAPHTIIHVQAMLYASLAASVFSAFLAMLGKQWLNRFASTDMRGTAIERSQDRQRKLDGIITWYFDHVMESLPLVLQFALLLLGCALSLYLWEIHVTIACVAIGVTALGVALYAFFVIAGTFSTSCPYQTPGAHILRHIYYRILSPAPGLLHSAFHILVLNSRCLRLFTKYAWGGLRDWKINIVRLIRNILYLPVFFVRDVRKLIFTTVKALIILSRRVSSWIRNARPARVRRLNQRTAVLDSRRRWKRVSACQPLKFLATIPTLADFTTALVSQSFDILIDCVKVNKGNPAVVQGMEQLGEASAMCLFLTYSHLSAVDPMSSVLDGIHQRYRRIFPLVLDPGELPFPHTLGTIHDVIHSRWPLETSINWKDYKPTDHEHAAVAHAFSKLCWSRGPLSRVSYQCLCFASHFLAQDPLPPPPIIANCLLIIAVLLRCNVPDTMILGESAQPEEVSDLIAQKLVALGDGYRVDPKSEPIGTLLVCSSAGATWRNRSVRCGPTFREGPELFTHVSPRAIILVTPHLDLERESLSLVQDLVPKWVAAVSVAPHTGEVARDVVDALLQIAANPDLRQLIPADVWLWLNERPSLPSESRGRLVWGHRDIFLAVRGLNNIEVLTSYLTLVWPMDYDGDFTETQMSVREDFNGIGVGRHRAELIQRVDDFLGDSDWEPGDHRRDQHEEIKRILRELDQEATEILNQSRSTFMCALPLPCP